MSVVRCHNAAAQIDAELSIPVSSLSAHRGAAVWLSPLYSQHRSAAGRDTVNHSHHPRKTPSSSRSGSRGLSSPASLEASHQPLSIDRVLFPRISAQGGGVPASIPRARSPRCHIGFCPTPPPAVDDDTKPCQTRCWRLALQLLASSLASQVGEAWRSPRCALPQLARIMIRPSDMQASLRLGIYSSPPTNSFSSSPIPFPSLISTCYHPTTLPSAQCPTSLPKSPRPPTVPSPLRATKRSSTTSTTPLQSSTSRTRLSPRSTSDGRESSSSLTRVSRCKWPVDHPAELALSQSFIPSTRTRSRPTLTTTTSPSPGR